MKNRPKWRFFAPKMAPGRKFFEKNMKKHLTNDKKYVIISILNEREVNTNGKIKIL